MRGNLTILIIAFYIIILFYKSYYPELKINMNTF